MVKHLKRLDYLLHLSRGHRFIPHGGIELLFKNSMVLKITQEIRINGYFNE